MVRTCEIAETCRNSIPRKKAKVAAQTGEDEPVDRLTSLPDSLLIHILSHLPTRDAVRSTLMIPSLGRLWDQTFNLEFDWCSTHICPRDSFEQAYVDESFGWFASFVDRALRLHRSPRVLKFRLKIDCATDYHHHRGRIIPRDAQEDEHAGNKTWLMELLDLWLESAVRRNVEIFYLDFAGCGFPGVLFDYILPASVLRCSSSVEMRLVGCILISYTGSCMKALKHLHLKEIVLTDNVIEDILSACPVLETLSLQDCFGFCRLSCESPMLKTVKVSPGVLAESKIEVSGPNITSLCISGWIERMLPGNLPSLHDATIDIYACFCVVPDEYVSVRKVFEKLHHAKVVTLHEPPILVTVIWELLGLQCPSSKWQCLVLKTMLNKWHLPGIVNLLRNSASLEQLDLYILPGELSPTPLQNAFLSWYKFDDDNYWTAKDHSFSCFGNGLKSVKISGDVMKNTVLQFVQFLLGKALALEELSIFVGMRDRSSKIEELEKYKEKVFNFPIASPNAVVKFC